MKTNEENLKNRHIIFLKLKFKKCRPKPSSVVSIKTKKMCYLDAK